MQKLRASLLAAVLRQYPFYSGCGSLANSNVVRRLSGPVRGQEWSRVPGGEVLANLEDFVGKAAYFVGDLDRKITWICRRIVREGDTVLDIGANIGLVTVLLADLVGSRGTVLSFEPNPTLSALLEKVIERNSFSNVALHPVALGPEEGTLQLFVPNANAGQGSLVRNREDVNDCQVYEVRVLPLDRIVSEAGIDGIRLMKIDVEGFEADVFAGAHEVLSTVRPDAILFELNEPKRGKLSEELLIQLLDSHGYAFFEIPKSMVRMKLKPWDHKSRETASGNDFLAAPLGKKFDEIARLVRASG